MLPTLTPHEFVTRWRWADLRERPAAQQHSVDLCRLVGHPTHTVPDSTDQISACCFDCECIERHKETEQAFALGTSGVMAYLEAALPILETD